MYLNGAGLKILSHAKIIKGNEQLDMVCDLKKGYHTGIDCKRFGFN